MKRMKKDLVVLCLLSIVFVFQGCLTMEPEATELEEVSWAEMANKDMMKENDNRYVTLKVQYLGVDAQAIPSQMLYSSVANVVLMNHIALGADYSAGVTTSLDSFLVGLPPGDETDNLMSSTDFGKTIEIVARTEYVWAGFGMFEHLLLRVESFNVVD